MQRITIHALAITLLWVSNKSRLEELCIHNNINANTLNWVAHLPGIICKAAHCYVDVAVAGDKLLWAHSGTWAFLVAQSCVTTSCSCCQRRRWGWFNNTIISYLQVKSKLLFTSHNTNVFWWSVLKLWYKIFCVETLFSCFRICLEICPNLRFKEK